MNRQFGSMILLLGLLLSFQSCRLVAHLPHIEIVSEEDSTVPVKKADSGIFVLHHLSPDTTTVKKELIKSIEPVWRKRISYNTFTAKARMEYQGDGKSYDLVTNIRLVKDSAIWMSVSALGGIIQVARALVTPDSLKAIVYTDKAAYLLPMDKTHDFLPAGIDFYSLQNLIVGNPVIEEGTATDATNFGGTWSIRFETDNYIQQLNYNMLDSSLRTCQLIARDKENLAMTMQCGNYKSVANRSFSDIRRINILNADKQYSLNVNFVNINFDVPVEFNFSIPRNYEIK